MTIKTRRADASTLAQRFVAVTFLLLVRPATADQITVNPVLPDGDAPLTVATVLDADERQRALGVQVLLGLPTGLRVGMPLVSGRNWHFQAEGTVGIIPIPDILGGQINAAGSVGVAGRAVVELSREGGCNAFRVGPAIGLMGVIGNRSALLGTADLTLGWAHYYGCRVGSEVGLYLGAGIENRVGLPLVGFYAGMQF